MSSTNKTSLGLNMWEASDKPVRQDFVNDNTIIDEKITNLNSNLGDISTMLQYPMVFRGFITGDLNRLDIPVGYYIIRSSSTVTNEPENAGYTVFIQFYGYNTQVIIGPNVRTRRYVGKTPSWGDWM